MHSLILDWSQIRSIPEAWDAICRAGLEPEWHGRNLNALTDSWVTGDINTTGPPYDFQFRNCPSPGEALFSFARSVMDIARESVKEKGGSFSAT